MLELKSQISEESQSLFFFYNRKKFRELFKISHITSTPSLARDPNAQTGAGHRDDVFALVLVPLPLGLGLWGRDNKSAKSDPMSNQQHR